MRRLCSIVILLVLGIMLFTPVPAHAAYDLPDAASNVSGVEAYQSVVTQYDQLYFIKFNITYTDPLDAPTLLSDRYIARIYDTATSTNVAVVRPWGIFSATGGCFWFAALYLTPDELTTLGYDPVADFDGLGASANWEARLEGDPALAWTGGVPPQWVTPAASFGWEPSTSTYTTDALIATRIRAYGVQWESTYPTADPLFLITGGVLTLTVAGQSYFTSTIPNLYTIAPELFPQVVTLASFPDAAYIKDYYLEHDSQRNVFGVNWVSQVWTPTLSYALSGLEFRCFVVGAPGTITVSLRATALGLPTGANLVTGTIDGNTLATYAAGEYVKVAFTADYPVVAGTVYSFVIQASAGNAGNYVALFEDSSGSYAGGNVCTSGDSGVTWVAVGASDLVFNVVSRDIVNDAFVQKQLDRTGDMFDDVGAPFGVSGIWIGSFLSFVGLGVLSYYGTRWANDYRPIWPIFVFGMPVFGVLGIMHWYIVIVFEFVLILTALLFFTRAQPE